MLPTAVFLTCAERASTGHASEVGRPLPLLGSITTFRLGMIDAQRVTSKDRLGGDTDDEIQIS